jgi:hypothetical protein
MDVARVSLRSQQYVVLLTIRLTPNNDNGLLLPGSRGPQRGSDLPVGFHWTEELPIGHGKNPA